MGVNPSSRGFRGLRISTDQNPPAKFGASVHIGDQPARKAVSR
jgi:hypothetical protein